MNYGPILCAAALVVGTTFAMTLPAQAPPLQAGVSVQLATTRHAVPLAAADRAGAWVAAVTDKGAAYFGVMRISPAELTAKLKTERSTRPDGMLFVKGDARAQYSAVAAVLSATRSAGLGVTALLTDQRSPAGASFPVPPMGIEVSLAAPAGTAAEAAGVVLEALAGQSVALRFGAETVSPGALAGLIRDRGLKVVTLRAGGSVSYQAVVDVIDICRSAGARVALALPVQ